jgi:CRISPR-associated protein Csb2
MSRHLCLEIHWHDRTYHGRGETGETERSPSPLRLFQALLAAAAARWRSTEFRDYAFPALHWLEGREPPTIVACEAEPSAGYRLYVPDNIGDRVAASWCRGGNETIANFRTEKDVKPMRLLGDGSVRYLWSIPDNDAEFERHREVLAAAARSITHLGWGIDLVAADASVIAADEATRLVGERWQPNPQSGESLRVPIDGSLDALVAKHAAFLTRLEGDTYRPVPPLSAFRIVPYRRADATARPFAAFRLLRGDGSGMAYFPATRAVTVAGMVRHAVAMSAEASGWDRARIDQFVLGHRERPEESLPRFAYLPLPTIEVRNRDEGGRRVQVVGSSSSLIGASRRNRDEGGRRVQVVGAIRRVLIAEPTGVAADKIAWARRMVTGQVVTNDRGELAALLDGIAQDGVLVRYVPRRPARTWTTVTPVVLPGCDEGKSRKTDKLLERMFEHAGHSLSDDVEDLTIRTAPLLRGAEPATRYRPGGKHYLATCSTYHMRVRWKRPSWGPLALGSGRFCGLGLFMSEDDG